MSEFNSLPYADGAWMIGRVVEARSPLRTPGGDRQTFVGECYARGEKLFLRGTTDFGPLSTADELHPWPIYILKAPDADVLSRIYADALRIPDKHGFCVVNIAAPRPDGPDVAAIFISAKPGQVAAIEKDYSIKLEEIPMPVSP